MNPAKPVSLGMLAALLPAVASAQSSNRYEGKTLTGDWGGTRTELFERGVAFRGDYVGEAMGVVDGGYGETGARYAQQVRVGVDLDMGKLAGWDGGAFHFTLNDRRGRSTSVDFVGNRFPIQEAYGGQYTRLTELSYDQTFNAGRSYYKLGYYAMGNQFGLHSLLTHFVNAAFCAHPLAMSGNSGWYNYPMARWGGEFAQQISPAVNVRTGWFQVNPNLGGNIERNAFRPFVSGTTGSLFPVEVTWTPAKGSRYAGVYKFGGYYDTSRVDKRGLDTSPTTGRHGAYVLAEQRLTQESADPSRGLTGFAQYMVSDTDTAQIKRWYALGGVYQGIGARAQDSIALGYVGADINHRLVDARRATLAAGGVPTDSPLYNLSQAEELFELSYSFQVNPWLMIRPDVQYIVNPGTFNYSGTDNAWAVGVQAKVTF
ncbi:carbohydrate porin [Stenotrophomonas indicatrix]|uniref:carbohydrate porin n=1 Tax=Stenotrophomonas indicatrix TaxID=2045451 RepID=UPI000C1934DF|nr:carbohydrate porin [Stenotrophomonas indicatrix]PII15514.1 carbohydrate porin [Stenotrophomonas indicatrix]